MKNLVAFLVPLSLLLSACAEAAETRGVVDPVPASSPASVSDPSPSFNRVHISGEPGSNGIYDPALAYSADGTVGWLAYTSADGEIVAGSELLHTHIARTTDGGATWDFIQRVNETAPVTVTLPNGQTVDGLWHYEVSSLVHDPDDRSGEWKLFSHKILWSREDGRNPAVSWITLRTASDPAGDWSAEVDLFGAGQFPPPPYDHQLFKLNEIDEDLANNLIYTEPGALVRDGVLYLSITGLVGQGSAGVFLLSSPDHGSSWRYVGTLLDDSHAAGLGVEALDGSSLAAVGNRVYLLAVPIGSPEYPDWVNGGTYVFEVTDLDSAQVAPAPLLYIPPQDFDSGTHGGGQATYHPGNTSGGIMIPQINLADRPVFTQIFNTGVQLAG